MSLGLLTRYGLTQPVIECELYAVTTLGARSSTSQSAMGNVYRAENAVSVCALRARLNSTATNFVMRLHTKTDGEWSVVATTSPGGDATSGEKWVELPITPTVVAADQEFAVTVNRSPAGSFSGYFSTSLAAYVFDANVTFLTGGLASDPASLTSAYWATTCAKFGVA